MNTDCTCGCCEGTVAVTPMPTANRPGLAALSYRVGTHATFLETMLARLSSSDFPALAALKTRDPGDPAIALMDSWATVADVLTFYQERIANEGYLRTALERRSVLELARLIGYELRPGVASTVYLAYTLDQDRSQSPPLPTRTKIAQGSRSQSVPGPGELPQSFETSEDLDARSEWNDLGPRKTQPQIITLPMGAVPPPETDADIIESIYFDGLSTNLKPGDPLLISLNVAPKPGEQFLRFVNTVDPQADQNRTEAVLRVNLSQITIGDFLDLLREFYADATTVFSGAKITDEVAALLQRPAGATADVPPGLLDVLSASTPVSQAVGLIMGVIPQLQELHDLATARNFTRLEPWLATRIQELSAAVEQAAAADDRAAGVANGPKLPVATQVSPLSNLTALLAPLSRPPSVQPASSLRLARSVAQTFSPQSDMAVKLLSAFNPAAAPMLYQAWENLEASKSETAVYAFRVKAGLFASSFPGAARSVLTETPVNERAQETAYVTAFTPPGLASAWDQTTGVLSLDAVYDKILPGSWVAIQVSVDSVKTILSYYKVLDVRTASLDSKSPGEGFTAKITQLQFDPKTVKPFPKAKPDDVMTGFLRTTVVYAQAELLTLAEEPLDIDIEGDTIQLDGVYDGLESGRWIIVSGTRTDIKGVTGVQASELAMVGGIAHGSRTAGCVSWPADLVPQPPFASIAYVSQPNEFGDRLVVGTLAADLPKAFSGSPMAGNQQYCDQVELAPGFWANAYVPGQNELGLQLGAFAGLLTDPQTGNSITVSGARPGWGIKAGNFWGWRISTGKVFTILTLANALAYSYDLNTVTIYGNVVKATNGATCQEVLGNGDGSQAWQQFTLKQPPLTFVSAANPSGVDSTLVVRVNDVEWHETDTLAGLGPKDRKFITQTDDGGNTTVIFGNGLEGARLPTGAGNIKAVYRNGIGEPGNVEAEQITLLQTKPLNVKAVINPLRASGGANADSRDQARRNAPLAVMALDRLVSTRDYADFARTFAGVSKASAVRLTDGQRELVHVTIAGVDDISIDPNSDLYNNLFQALHIEGDTHQPLQLAVTPRAQIVDRQSRLCRPPGLSMGIGRAGRARRVARCLWI